MSERSPNVIGFDQRAPIRGVRMSAATTASPPPFPLLERPAPATALAIVAGMLNAWTFSQTQTFATVQSGNVISIGYFLIAGDLSRVGVAVGAIVAFTVGAFLGTLVVLTMSRAGRAYPPTTLGLEAVLIVGLVAAHAAGLSPIWAAWSVSLVAGIQGNAFHREAGMLYGNVAVTSVLQMAGSLLGRAAGQRIASDHLPHVRPAADYLVVLIGFAGGGAFGFALDRVADAASLVAAAIVLAVLAVIAARTRGPIDPQQ